MARFFSEGELESLVIDRFIFHVIRRDDSGPVILPPVELNADHEVFFRSVIRMGAKRLTPFIFQYPETNERAHEVLALFQEDSDTFYKVAEALTVDFHARHLGHVADGIFAVVLARIAGDYPIVVFLKMDHQQVVSFRESGEKWLLESIANPLVQTPEALQKIAFFDIGGDREWEVLASDRATSGPLIAQYFAEFLQVEPHVSNSDLTLKSIDSVRQWADLHMEDLGEMPDTYRARAADYLQHQTSFEIDQFSDSVLETVEEEERPELVSSLKQFLSTEGLKDEVFVPDVSGFKDKRKIITADGVKIEWDGDRENRGIEIERSDKGIVITIKSRDIKFGR